MNGIRENQSCLKHAQNATAHIGTGSKQNSKKICKNCGLSFIAATKDRRLCDNCTQKRPFEVRFWSKVNIKGIDDCWEWAASLDGKGYGQVIKAGKPKRSHRVAYELTFGEIPGGKFLCHTCDNKKCVNPNHLFVGSPLDNIRDMDKKGRRISSPHYGEEHGMSKLKNIQVVVIKELLKNKRMSQRSIAKYFKAHFATINHIKTGRQWRSV